jgi:phage baseplate assembly protein W
MGSYSFKHVGQTQQKVIEETQVKSIVNIGIKTPLRLGTTEIFEMSTQLDNQVADNFRNMILTNWGERLGLFNFGADLKPVLANLINTEDFDTEIMQRISTATAKWMPYIDLNDFQSSIDRSSDNHGLAKINLKITFSVPALQVKKRTLELTLYAL